MRLEVPNAQYYRDDWALNGFAQSFIFVHDVTVLVSPSRLKEVKFDDIDYAGIDCYPERAGWNCNYSEVKHLFHHCNTDEERNIIVNKVADECMHLRDTQERF